MSTNAIKVGSAVTFTADAAEMLGFDALHIFEIVDCRLGHGGYSFAVSCVGALVANRFEAPRYWVLGEDLKPVRQ